MLVICPHLLTCAQDTVENHEVSIHTLTESQHPSPAPRASWLGILTDGREPAEPTSGYSTTLPADTIMIMKILICEHVRT